MRKYNLAIFLFAVIINGAYAQYDEHALRYSQSVVSGTSRIQGLGGANVALGADISSAQLNPAGLGLLRKSEFSITAGLGQASTNSRYFNTSSSGTRGLGSIPNFGMAFSHIKDEIEEGKFRGGTFGITYTKVNNFQNSFNYSGTNTINSIGDYFAEAATGTIAGNMDNKGLDDLTSLHEAAYKSDIIDPIYHIVDNNGNLDTVQAPGNPYQYAWEPASQNQNETVESRGGQYAWNFAYGGNYNDKIFFGIGLGITKINYSTEKYYSEDVLYGPEVITPGLTNINLFEKYTSKGTGINLKGGIIAKASDNVRLGLSFVTPTYYRINEKNDFSFNSMLRNQDYPIDLIGGTNTYNLTTPMKVTPGVAFLFGKSGFITGEIDYVPYTKSSIRGNSIQSSYKADNQKISNDYLNTINYRVGGEYRYDIFRFRAGLNYQGDPYRNPVINRGMLSISGGAGVRVDNLYIDIVFVNSSFNSLYSPYFIQNTAEYGETPVANIKNVYNTFNITFGTFF